jgi:hypothetical protein
VPATIVYDRTKTVVRRHVGRGQATPLHPEAVAFAAPYGFAIWLAAPYRAQTKGRVERQVEIVRSHVLEGRSFASLAEMDAAFATWLPTRRSQVHRTHGEVISVRAERDRAALGRLPEHPYVVCERHTRRVGKDALVSFQASHYSVPWPRCGPAAGGAAGHPGRGGDLVTGTGPGPGGHPLSRRRAGRLDRRPTHWEGLPNRTDAEPMPPCAADCDLAPTPPPEPGQLALPELVGWAQTAAARTPVARRRLAVYDQLVGVAS